MGIYTRTGTTNDLGATDRQVRPNPIRQQPTSHMRHMCAPSPQKLSQALCLALGDPSVHVIVPTGYRCMFLLCSWLICSRQLVRPARAARGMIHETWTRVSWWESSSGSLIHGHCAPPRVCTLRWGNNLKVNKHEIKSRKIVESCHIRQVLQIVHVFVVCLVVAATWRVAVHVLVRNRVFPGRYPLLKSLAYRHGFT